MSGRSTASSMTSAIVSNPTGKTLEGVPTRIGMRNSSYINRRAKAFQKQGQPVISVDTKKKELVGQFRNGGREWHPQGQPEEVQVHDFPDKALGKVIPYGVYDEATNTGWVSVGIDHDTAEFAVETMRRWWRHMGSEVYPRAKRLLITADGGGSQREPVPPVEGGVAAVGRRDRAAHLGVPLPARDEQVEQDRTTCRAPARSRCRAPA